MRNIFLVTILLGLINQTALAHNHKKDSHDHHGHDEHSLDAHEHGNVKLNVVVDDKKPLLFIDLEGPSESFIGFEYAPKTAAEKKDLEAVKEFWKNNINELFVISDDLGCSLKELSSKRSADDHSGHDHGKSGEHSEMKFSLKYECKKVVKNTTIDVLAIEKFNSLKLSKKHQIESVKAVVIPAEKLPYEKEFSKQFKVSL